MKPKLSIIILNYNTSELTIGCVKSIVKYSKNITYEIIIIDNASSDESVSKLKEFTKNSRYIRFTKNNENIGFAKGNNVGIKQAEGEYTLLLNSDTEFVEDSITKIYKWIKNKPRAGIVSCKLLNKDMTLQANGGSFPTLFRVFLWATFIDDIPGLARLFGSYHSSVSVPISKNIYKSSHQKDWLSGAFMFARTDLLRQIKGFNDDIFMYGEDVELCFRIKKLKWEVWYTPITRIIHIGSASSGGSVVSFAGTAVGKISSIIGEFNGLLSFYKKYYPGWRLWVLKLLLKMAAMLRIIVFGIIGKQKSAITIYEKAITQI